MGVRRTLCLECKEVALEEDDTGEDDTGRFPDDLDRGAAQNNFRLYKKERKSYASYHSLEPDRDRAVPRRCRNLYLPYKAEVSIRTTKESVLAGLS